MKTLKTVLMVLGFALFTASLNAAGAGPDPAEAKVKEKFVIKMMGLAIGLAGTVMGIGIVLLAIWTDYKKRRALITLCHQERIAALEKGLEVPPFPPEVLEGVQRVSDKPKNGSLKPGLMWLVIGVGLTLFLALQSRADIHPSIGTIPAGIGLVHLICHWMEKRRRASQ